jgi:pyocin large subunit-like protein
MNYRILLAAGLFAGLGLSACERSGVASEPAREQAAVASPDSADAAGEREYAARGGESEGRRAPDAGDRDDPREGPQPLHDTGAPVWAANSRLAAEEAAQRQFERNGQAFGADTVEAYVDQAHAFISKPPSGVERVTRSRNGDTLMYDAKSNTFLVATRDGAPRTMFKPDDGAEYWTKQKQQAAGGERARAGGSNDRG